MCFIIFLSWKRKPRDAAKKVVWGEKVAGEKRKAAMVGGNDKLGSSSRARTDSPRQGHDVESPTRPRSWSVSVPGPSTHVMLTGAHAENSLHARTHSLSQDHDFGEGGSSRPWRIVPAVTVPLVHERGVASSHTGAVPPAEGYDPEDFTRSRSLSVGSSVDVPLAGPSNATHPDLADDSVLDRIRQAYPSLGTERSDDDEDLKSDRFWSEAPFAEGNRPLQWRNMAQN